MAQGPTSAYRNPVSLRTTHRHGRSETHGAGRYPVVQSLPPSVQPGSLVRSQRQSLSAVRAGADPRMHGGRLFDAVGSSLTFVIDETLERRRGRRINKRGHSRDPPACSRKRSVSTRGLRWIVLTLVVTPPWTTRCRALPIPGSSPGQALSVPAPTPQVSERLGLRHKTIAQWARQMIRVLRRWLPHVAITVLGDQAYSVVELAHASQCCGVRLIAPLRLDAVLHEAPPPRQPGMRGRPPLKACPPSTTLRTGRASPGGGDSLAAPVCALVRWPPANLANQ